MTDCSDVNPTIEGRKYNELALMFQVLSKGQPVKLGKYYPFENGDSISIIRLDFYAFKPVLRWTGKKYNIDSILLISMYSDSNIFTFKVDTLPSELDSISFLVGLDFNTNQSDPNKFPPQHPLSAYRNMYWTSWTQYRYVVFEGEIKDTANNIYRLSFHTGMEFGNTARIRLDHVVQAGSRGMLNLRLHLEKLFYPQNPQNSILYKSGEMQAHSDPSDALLTDKFAKNFAQAFTVE